jgi:hypothetical protein
MITPSNPLLRVEVLYVKFTCKTIPTLFEFLLVFKMKFIFLQKFTETLTKLNVQFRVPLFGAPYLEIQSDPNLGL